MKYKDPHEFLDNILPGWETMPWTEARRCLRKLPARRQYRYQAIAALHQARRHPRPPKPEKKPPKRSTPKKEG